MFGLAEFAIRLSARYGALAGFIAFAGLSVIALVMLARLGFRAPVWGGAALVGVLSAALLAAPAWKSVTHLRHAFAARGAATPAPSGPFAVGDIVMSLAPRGAGAPIEVRVWYPRDTDGAARPLILYAPGIGGTRDQNTLLTADLASHGYVVVGFDDLSQTPAPADETPEQRAVREGVFDFTSRAALEETVARSAVRADLQARKAIDILDRFSAIAHDASTPWGGRVDVARVGFLGFSFGGATAAEASILDPRIVAVANIDGTLFGRAEAADLTIPYLLILSDMRQLTPLPQSWRRDFLWVLDQRELARAHAQALRPRTEVLEVRMAGHAAFTDEYFDESYLSSWLKIDPFRAYAIVQSRVLSLFTTYLPAEGAAAPAIEQRYDEVLEFGSAP